MPMSRRKPNVTARRRPAQDLATGSDPMAPSPGPVVGPEAALPPVVSPPDTEPEPLLGEVMPGVLASQSVSPRPGFAMSDTPFDGQTPDDSDRALLHASPSAPTGSHYSGSLNPNHNGFAAEGSRPTPVLAAGPAAGLRPAGHASVPAAGVAPAQSGGAEHPLSAGGVSYIQRVSVVSAYHFDGRVQTAPPWVDRNWLGWNDIALDERGTGVVLELPGIGLCRVGDYIVQQDVLVDGFGSRVNQLAVYDRDEFERMFLPVTS